MPVDLAGVAARMERRHGAQVRPWMAGLTDRLARLARQWSLDLGDPFPEGNSAVSVRARRSGAPVVLKVSPDRTFAAEQGRVLRALAPSGRVPEVFESDEDGALLLGAVVPGTSGLVGARAPSAAEFGALLTDLHTAVADPASVVRRDLSGWTGEYMAGFERRDGPGTAADFGRARELCARLLADPGEPVLLHGDLHAGNLLDGGPERGLVVIDPKASVGDPEYDAVDYVLDGAGAEGIEPRRDALLAVTGLDPARLDLWCRALAVAVAVSAVREGQVAALLTYARG